jgi:hypothetical protein
VRRLFPQLSVLPLFVLVGCGDAFVEPTPPELEWADVRQAEVTVEEPVVLGVITDLALWAEDRCAQMSDALAEVHTASSKAAVGAAYRLPTIHLSASCAQHRDRRLPAGVTEALEEAVGAFEGAAARPLILYVNNVDAPLSSGLVSDLKALRAPLSNGLVPLLWVVGPTAVAEQLAPDEHLPWTWTGDPDLLPRIGARLDQKLPLWSGHPPERVEVLPGGLRERAVALKVCRHSPHLVAGSVPLDGTPVPFTVSVPAHLRVAGLEPRLARSGPAEAPRELEWSVEVCTARCDRTLPAADGGLGTYWKSTRGCTREDAR